MTTMERGSNRLALAREVVCQTARHDATATPRDLFALVYGQMRALAGRRDVGELAQEAAEKAIRGLPSFAGRSSLSTWTFRICYLTIRKHDRWYRRWLRRFTLTSDGRTPEVAGDLASAQLSALSPEERLAQEERIVVVRAALERLSPKRRSVVVLHDLEELSVAEIADIVGAQPRAVRSRLRDGRRALAEVLASDPYFGAEASRRRGRP